MTGMTRGLTALTAVALLGLAPGAGLVAQQDADTVVVPFSDPSRIGKLVLTVVSGAITVKGENRRDVSVGVDHAGEKPSVRLPAPAGPAQGLRRLAQSPGFTVEEEQNEIKIEGTSFGRSNGTFEIRVPARTNLKLSSVNGGPITVENVEGDLEIQNVNGSVVLTNVGGTVVANSVNGGVKATLTRVTAQKAMAFTSLNGPVDVTLPASIKATFKLRSDQGEIFTDFDVQVRPPAPAPAPDTGRRAGGKYRLEVNRSIYGTVNGGGPEIELRTFNGSVFLRKGAQ